MAAGLNMVIIEAPFEMHAGYASGQMVIPKNHLDICKYDNANLNIVRPGGSGLTASASISASNEVVIIIASTVAAAVLILLILASYYYCKSKSDTRKGAGQIDLSTISKSENSFDIMRMTSRDGLIDPNGVILEDKQMIFIDQSRN